MLPAAVTRKRPTTNRDWLPLARAAGKAGELPTGEAFRPEWIDFTHGIRVGNLEPHERITQILKFHLEQRYRTPFVTDRWGRGVYWQWICWLPKANRLAKPVSHASNFSCAKLFISADGERGIFKSGLQVERGYIAGPEAVKPWGLREDFDWHRLRQQCKAGSVLDREVQRLVAREGFIASVIGEDFRDHPCRTALEIARAARACRPDRWTGLQLYYPMPKRELRQCTGLELVKAIEDTFAEVIPAMNACMQVALA